MAYLTEVYEDSTCDTARDESMTGEVNSMSVAANTNERKSHRAPRLVPTAPTIVARALRKLLDFASSVGLDAQQIAKRADLDLGALDDSDARVPVTWLHRLWDVVVAETGRRDLALTVANRYTAADYALLGLSCVHSPTLGEALGHLVRYLRLWCDEPRLALEPGGRLVLSYGTPFEPSPGLWCATEATFAEIVHVARYAARDAGLCVAASFAHPAQADPGVYRAYFRARVQFAAPRSELVFGPTQLAMRLSHADPDTGQFLRTLANQALVRYGEGMSLRSRIAGVFADRMQHGVPKLPVLARELGMGERTLRRRLRQEGVTFRGVLDATRAELAQSCLRDHRVTIAEVAFLLGFSEPSAFLRAFKRWTGRTPAAFRATHGP